LRSAGASAVWRAEVVYPRRVRVRALVLSIVVGLSIVLLTGAAYAAVSAPARIPPPFQNCTQLNKRYPHGVGKLHAHDHTTGTPPVTNFKHSTKLVQQGDVV
jgi:hypothetical protein